MSVCKPALVKVNQDQIARMHATVILIHHPYLSQLRKVTLKQMSLHPHNKLWLQLKLLCQCPPSQIHLQCMLLHWHKCSQKNRIQMSLSGLSHLGHPTQVSEAPSAVVMVA